MNIILALALTSSLTPAFEPLRAHEWGESMDQAATTEAGIPDSSPDASTGDSPFLRFTLQPAEPFEYFALLFQDAELVKIMYPINLPGQEGPATGSSAAEQFVTVKAWFNNHFGEPELFSSSLPGASLESVQTLPDSGDFELQYTWCHKNANAHLFARRENGGEPMVIASVESPGLPADPIEVESGHSCKGID